MNLIEVILPGAASGKPVEGGVISAWHAEEFLMMVGADCPASSSCTLNDFLLRADPICTEADGGAEADADAPGGQSFWMPVTPLPLPVPQAVTDDLDRGGQACPAMTLDRPAARPERPTGADDGTLSALLVPPGASVKPDEAEKGEKHWYRPAPDAGKQLQPLGNQEDFALPVQTTSAFAVQPDAPTNTSDGEVQPSPIRLSRKTGDVKEPGAPCEPHPTALAESALQAGKGNSTLPEMHRSVAGRKDDAMAVDNVAEAAMPDKPVPVVPVTGKACLDAQSQGSAIIAGLPDRGLSGNGHVLTDLAIAPSSHERSKDPNSSRLLSGQAEPVALQVRPLYKKANPEADRATREDLQADLSFSIAQPTHMQTHANSNSASVHVGQSHHVSESSIFQQLASAASQVIDHPVEVTLSPEELGKVRMTLVTADGTLTLALVADRQQTLDLMRRHIDQLAQDFRALGYQNLNFTFAQSHDRRPGQSGGDDRSAKTPPDQYRIGPDIAVPVVRNDMRGIDLRF